MKQGEKKLNIEQKNISKLVIVSSNLLYICNRILKRKSGRECILRNNGHFPTTLL